MSTELAQNSGPVAARLQVVHWPRPKAKIKVSDGVKPVKCSVWIYCSMEVHRLSEKQFQQMLS